MQKILVVGGTGMLTGLVKDLSKSSEVWVIGRNLEKLKIISTISQNIHSISVDYTNLEELENKLSGLVFDKIISWIHSDQAARSVAYVIAKHCRGDFYDITGSEGRKPEHPSHIREEEIATLKEVSYHRVVLGSHGTHWLSDPEICTGVMHAIHLNQPEFIVGN